MIQIYIIIGILKWIFILHQNQINWILLIEVIHFIQKNLKTKLLKGQNDDREKSQIEFYNLLNSIEKDAPKFNNRNDNKYNTPKFNKRKNDSNYNFVNQYDENKLNNIINSYTNNSNLMKQNKSTNNINYNPCSKYYSPNLTEGNDYNNFPNNKYGSEKNH